MNGDVVQNLLGSKTSLFRLMVGEERRQIRFLLSKLFVSLELGK
jgi:hypothetical protein